MTDTPTKPKPKRHAPGDGGTLTARQRAFAHGIAQGLNAKNAALAAGYSPRSTKSQTYDLLKHPLVKAEIDRLLDRVRDKVAYTAIDAFNEAEEAREVAKKTRNATAMVHASRLRAQIMGLLIDKHEIKVDKVDLNAALTAANARILPPLQLPNPEAVLPMRDQAAIEDAEFADASNTCDAGRSDSGSVPDSRRVPVPDMDV